jgi:hypothetical protein
MKSHDHSGMTFNVIQDIAELIAGMTPTRWNAYMLGMMAPVF